MACSWNKNSCKNQIKCSCRDYHLLAQGQKYEAPDKKQIY